MRERRAASSSRRRQRRAHGAKWVRPSRVLLVLAFSSFHRVAAAFEAGGTRFTVARVLLLSRLLLLLRRLLLRCRVLTPALRARSDGARRSTCACVVTDDLADDRPSRGTAGARATRASRCSRSRRRRCRLLLWRGLRGIYAGLIDRPLMALVLVLLLLLGRLPLRGVDELLRLHSRRRERGRDRQHCTSRQEYSHGNLRSHRCRQPVR